MPELAVEGLEVRHGAVAAVRDVSFTVDRGEIVGLIGPNGAGKTTTLLSLMGAIRPAKGDVRLGGRSVVGRKPEDIARAGMALVPEGRRIFAHLTVEENLRLGTAGSRDPEGFDTAVARVHELFPIVREFAHRPAGSLSGGQQQQLAIGRALVAGPDVILLDEPSLGLAPTVVDVVFHALRAIADTGVGVLLVEQRAQRTVAASTRTHVIANGEIRMTLGPGDAEDTQRIVAAYLA